MDIAALKQQARALEQQGNAGEALAVYQQILSELDALGGMRQELPLLIKIGDLQLKAGDVDGAVDMYERAADEYAQQGAAQPVMSLCIKIVRADPQAVGSYLRLARRLLDSGYTDGARDVLMDYAQRAKLEKTRQGLEILAGRAEDEVKRVLAKAIDVAEQRVPNRPERAARPAPPQPPPPEEPAELKELEQPPEEPPTKKRFTVPVGALDAEPEPNLMQQRPPEKRPEVFPESAFPTAAEVQAPKLPEVPPALRPPTPPAPPAPPVIEPLPPQRPAEPPQVETMSPWPEAPPLPPLPSPPSEVPPLRVSSELILEPSFAAPTPTPPPDVRRSETAIRRPSRVSRSQPRVSQALAAAQAPSRGTPRWLWALLASAVVVGGAGALVWFQIIPLDRLRNALPGRQREPAQVQPGPARPIEPVPDTVMARDTAVAESLAITRPAVPPVAQEPPPARLVPPTLPPGVVVRRPIYVVAGLAVESVEEIMPQDRPGFWIVQVLSADKRIILEQFPLVTPASEGEIGVTALPPDTVVGHVVIGGMDVTLKGVIPETLAVDLLQRLVVIRP